MTENITPQIIRLVAWFATPLAYGVLLFLFFFLFVRPFFAYIFDPQRLARKKIIDAKKKKNAAALELHENVDFQNLSHKSDGDNPPLMSDDQKIAKPGVPDSESGGNLVKKWLHSEK
ncbi:MAG: hypothetical protein RI601_03150 [Desulfurivibrionaceae bacterium]|nr:hypothetical protein [Desulfurivibrionaceae bacterium]